MSHAVLERHLKKSTLKPVYLWFGEEEFLIRRALARLEAWLQQRDDLAAKTVLDGTETPLAEALSAARSPQLWGGRQLVIVWQAERYKAEELAVLEKYLQAPSSQTCLVLIASGLKPKDVQAHSLWRQLLEQEAALGFPRLREGELPTWLETGGEAPGENPGARRSPATRRGGRPEPVGFRSGTGKTYFIHRGRSPLLRAADAAKLSSHSRTHTIFELVEALGQSRPDKALKVLDRLLELGEQPSVILVMLARQIRLLMRTREGLKRNLDATQLAKELGVPKFVAEKLQKQAPSFRLAQLKGQLIRLHEADQGIKTGMAVSRLLLEKVILDLCPLPTLKLQPQEH